MARVRLENLKFSDSEERNYHESEADTFGGVIIVLNGSTGGCSVSGRHAILSLQLAPESVLANEDG